MINVPVTTLFHRHHKQVTHESKDNRCMFSKGSSNWYSPNHQDQTTFESTKSFETVPDERKVEDSIFLTFTHSPMLYVWHMKSPRKIPVLI